MLVSWRVHCLSLWIILVTRFVIDFPENMREQKCQRDSGVLPTTRTHCPNTVSALTLKALLQSLHGVMPNMQGTGSEVVAEIKEMIWEYGSYPVGLDYHFDFHRFSIWNDLGWTIACCPFLLWQPFWSQPANDNSTVSTCRDSIPCHPVILSSCHPFIVSEFLFCNMI